MGQKGSVRKKNPDTNKTNYNVELHSQLETTLHLNTLYSLYTITLRCDLSVIRRSFLKKTRYNDSFAKSAQAVFT
jgi:hypothetical protein